MFKTIVCIIILLLLSPLFTSIGDSLCWFYTSSTCTGLTYDMNRVGVLLLMSLASLMLAFVLIG